MDRKCQEHRYQPEHKREDKHKHEHEHAHSCAYELKKKNEHETDCELGHNYEQDSDLVHNDAEHSHIHQHGLCNHNHEHNHNHAHGQCHDHSSEDHPHACDCRPEPALTKPLPKSTIVGNLQQSSMRITQMDCPVEEQLIRKKLQGLKVVHDMQFNLLQRVLTVTHEIDALPLVVKALGDIGFTSQFSEAGIAAGKSEAEPAKSWWLLALSGCFAVVAELGDWFSWPQWLVLVCSIIAIVLAGTMTYRKGWFAIRNLNMNINALMSIAVTGALLIGHWPEAAMVMVLFTIAERIEAKSMARARNAIAGLMELAPKAVTLVQADGSLSTTTIDKVAMNAVIRVKPGERIGLDGVVVRGQSTINQAPITGESLPVDKNEGDAVFAGTINESSSIDYRVTATAQNTTLARIIHAVEEAQGEKAPTQRFVDKFAQVYTPVVLVIALLVAVLPPLFMGDWLGWVYKALVLLVIACPCALVISTPVTVVSGLAAAACNGILIKGGVYLEEGRKLKVLALDKTGTLTHGKPVQTDFVDFSGQPQQSKLLVASLAGESDHPLSQAITNAANIERKDLLLVNEFTAMAGRGTLGVIGGQDYWLGNHRLIHEQGLCSPALEAQIEILEKQGKTVVLLAHESQILALLALADTVKETSQEAIRRLKQMGVKTVMLSGDNSHTANAIGQQVDIDEVFGDLLPTDKLQTIANLSEGGMVGMVGDGINDAPALARANIGFAMGAIGTDTAIETADIALMDDDLRKIPAFLKLSRITGRILVENISLALGIKLIFVILTLMNLSSMWMAVFADVGVSLLVVANGLRLLRYRTL